jgi:release factor glutamine methyltransferase
MGSDSGTGRTGVVPGSIRADAPIAIAMATRITTAKLTAAGMPDASTDARRLVCHVLDTTPARLIADPDRTLTSAEIAALDFAVARRLTREPVSRIEGRRHFFGRTFIVTPDVLDPRPDTETVVETALDILGSGACGTAPRILDIGTGSGAILLTLLAERDGATGTGLDISPAALAVARLNAEALGLVDRANFTVADVRVGLPSGFDLWLSNPPYIPTNDIPFLDEDVRNHDPLVALDGGPDGLDMYRAVLAAAATLPDGRLPQWIVFEAGAGQADAIIGLAAAKFAEKLANVRTVSDLGGHTRCVAFAPHRPSH